MNTLSVIPGNVQVKVSFDGSKNLMSIISPSGRMLVFAPYYYKVSNETLNFLARVESAWSVRQGIEAVISITCDMPLKIMKECLSFPEASLWEPQEIEVEGVEPIIVYNQICD